jgi:ankyrin repeat protein
MNACSQKKNMEENTLEIFNIIAANDSTKLSQWLSVNKNVELRNSKGETPLMNATYSHRIALAKMLIDAGANVNQQDNMLNSPFLYAGASGYLEILQLCLKAGANYKVFNRYNGTALIPACERGHIAIVTELLKDKNYPIDHINKLGWTALLEAVILGDGSDKYVKIVQLLVNADCDISIKDKDGVDALSHAKKRNFKEITAALEEAAKK